MRTGLAAVIMTLLFPGILLAATLQVGPGSPYKTISAAMQVVKPGDTILVGAGVYREKVIYPGEDWKDPQRRITLAAVPGARPVITGSDPVPGPWQRETVQLAKPPARPAAIYSCAWPQRTSLVFVEGASLKQIGLQASPARASSNNGFQFKKQWVGKTVADMQPGSFFYDEPTKRLLVWLADGSDPAKRKLEASVRDEGLNVRGTWTVRGITVQHIQDGFWPREQAMAVAGDRSIIEGCRIEYNDILGLITGGQDIIVRNNVIAYNGLMGYTSNVGYRMLVEGNEFHHNAWRGDVVCLTAGNKFVFWRDARFLRNWWHDEPACALWMDISNADILIAENRFDDCACGVYWEISRWAVIANNVFRHCGRGIWSYGADALIAHNVLDRCGEGITVTGAWRTATWAQSVKENPASDPLMATHNNLIVDNLLLDCAASFIGITQGQPHGWGNWSDYNAFVWTMPAYHPTGGHLNFMNGWDQYYGKLPIWRTERHCDTHSVVVDAGQLKSLHEDNPWVGLTEQEVFADARIKNREQGDYHLLPDSPLRDKGVALPMTLNSYYAPQAGDAVVTRAFAKTRLAEAPDPKTAKPVFGTADNGHYRLQPLPRLHPLVELDGTKPGPVGLNEAWARTGKYPQFTTAGEPDTAADDEWALLPTNLLSDPGFDKPLGTPWAGSGGMHTYTGMACVNLGPSQLTNALCWQKVGTVRAGCEYLLTVDMTVNSVSKDYAGVAEIYLAAGDPAKPLAGSTVLRAEPGQTRAWNTRYLHVRTATNEPLAGQDLYVVLAARAVGPAGSVATEPVAFARWDDVWLLSSP